jgi:hypothetical protein
VRDPAEGASPSHPTGTELSANCLATEDGKLTVGVLGQYVFHTVCKVIARDSVADGAAIPTQRGIANGLAALVASPVSRTASGAAPPL